MSLSIRWSLFVGQMWWPTSSMDSISLSLVQTNSVKVLSEDSQPCRHNVPPSVFYLGLPHAGSTDLAEDMNEHPSMSYGDFKEHRFWAGGPSILKIEREHRSVDDYMNEFNVLCEKNITFDATPFMLLLGREESATNCTGCGYTSCAQTKPYRFPRIRPGRAAIEDFKNIVPSNSKFLAMFRDPMDASGSHYPGDVVEQPCHSCDADNLEVWLSMFPRDQFFFIDSNEYFANQEETTDAVYKWIGVEPMKSGHEKSTVMGRRRSTVEIDMEARIAFHSNPKHKECKRRLEAMTGLKFDWKGSD